MCFWLKPGGIIKFMYPPIISRNLITSTFKSPVFSGNEDRFLFAFLFFPFFFLSKNGCLIVTANESELY